jgi:transcription initiation factor TFIIA large subunit
MSRKTVRVEKATFVDLTQINSELDDDSSDGELNEGDHVMLCQYEKVSRVKNKWKVVLKDGIMNVNGRDYLFSRVTIAYLGYGRL